MCGRDPTKVISKSSYCVGVLVVRSSRLSIGIVPTGGNVPTLGADDDVVVISRAHDYSIEVDCVGMCM